MHIQVGLMLCLVVRCCDQVTVPGGQDAAHLVSNHVLMEHAFKVQTTRTRPDRVTSWSSELIPCA